MVDFLTDRGGYYRNNREFNRRFCYEAWDQKLG